MKMPPVVSRDEWEAARAELLVEEKALTRARDALAAKRRRMPRMRVDEEYRFEGPDGPATLDDLFEGRRQLIVYRFFYEPGVSGWPERGCGGCSFLADQVAHLAHLNARDTTLAFVSRAPQPDIERWKARMGWDIPWYTLTDDFDADFGVAEWHGTNAFYRGVSGHDLRVGGELRVVMRNPHDGAEYGGGGRYTEIVPPTRLAFTWLWDDNPIRQLIEIDFEERDGVTTVRFTHSGLWDEEAVRSHEDGWTKAFDNLQRTVEG